MKKQINKFVVLLIAIFALGGCSEDYLNEPKPAGVVSEDVVFNSRQGAEAYISGILRRSRGQFTTGHDAGGINSMYFARSVKGNDVIIGTSWFNFDYDQDNREPSYRRTTFSWNFPYFMINQANTLINGIENSEVLSDEDKADLKGQGLALRAFYYFQLVMEFQHTYGYDPSLPALPIYLELSLEGKPMSTVEEVYVLIVSDLTEAIEGLDDSRLDKSYINKNVAQGMLARVYQVMENWEGAEEMANAAYGGALGNALAAGTYDNGFNDMNTSPEWMWALPQYDDQTMFYYSAPHAQADHFNTSYLNAYVNSDFVNLFSDTDVRALFANPYNVAATNYRYWVTTKFDFASFGVDIPLMRTPEMILIEAEALYHQGDGQAAHDLLYSLQVNRDPSAVKSSNTGNALFEEILVERRKELYMEIGVEWFDAKRLQRGITRTGNHRILKNLEPNDNRFFLKIPQPEIDANPFIDASVNSNR